MRRITCVKVIRAGRDWKVGIESGVQWFSVGVPLDTKSGAIWYAKMLKIALLREFWGLK